MNLTSELYVLTLVALVTALMWVPYVIARILTQGLMAAFANPEPSHPAASAWAQRARLAHANAVENLAVFAPLVLVANAIGASTPGTVLAAKLYLAARLVHYVVFAAGIPIVRTLAFLAGAGATIFFAATIFNHVL